MTLSSPFSGRRKGTPTYTNGPNDLQPAGSRITRTIASICACSLVVASMGMGGLFAYTVGIQHGPLLAGLTVLMAIALEGIKPLAVSSALASFRQLALVRGLLLTLLASVAIAYSLTAELSLVAGSRGDLAAKREAAIESHDDRREAIKAARAELASLAPSRTIEEVKADVAKLLAANPAAGDCRGPALNAYRTVCARVAALNGEIARSKRRADLQQTIAKATDGPAPAIAVKAADPGAASLATYLGTLGFNVTANKLADWLVLVPVFALELGAALSAVLVQAVYGAPTERHIAPVATFATERRAQGRPGPRESASEPMESADPSPWPDPNKPTKRTRSKPARRTKRDAQKRLGNVVRIVRENGGKITASQQDLANRLRVSKTRAHELLRELESAGHVELTTSRDGTTVRLVG